MQNGLRVYKAPRLLEWTTILASKRPNKASGAAHRSTLGQSQSNLRNLISQTKRDLPSTPLLGGAKKLSPGGVGSVRLGAKKLPLIRSSSQRLSVGTWSNPVEVDGDCKAQTTLTCMAAVPSEADSGPSVDPDNDGTDLGWADVDCISISDESSQ